MISRDHKVGSNVWFLAETSAGSVLHGRLALIAGVTAVIEFGGGVTKRAVRDCYETEGEALFVRAEQLTAEIALRQSALNSTLQRLVRLTQPAAAASDRCACGKCPTRCAS